MNTLYIFIGIIVIILCSRFCNNVNENNIGKSHYPIFLKERFNRNNNFCSNVYNNIGRKKIKKNKNVYPHSLGYIFLPLYNKLSRSNTNNNVSINKCLVDYVPNKKKQGGNIFLFHNVHVINKKMKFQKNVSICAESKKRNKKRNKKRVNHVFMDKNLGDIFESNKTEGIIDKNKSSNVINNDSEYNHPNIHNNEGTYNNIDENNPMYEGMPNHLSDSNLESAMKKAEEYIKGKEDDIIERREKEKKKKIVEKMKDDEDVFTDKLLDLRIYDMLKYVYRNNIYRTSHELVNNICMWMKSTYSNYVDTNKEIQRREKKKQEEEKKDEEEKNKKKEELINISDNEKDTKHNETNINYKRVNVNDKDVNIHEDIIKGKKAKEKTDDEIQSEIIEKDISTNYSKDRNVQYLNTFSFDKNNEKLNSEMESLKLYNKKNLSKYFFSLYKGNILKQLVTEGEDLQPKDEYIERKKKDDTNKYDSNNYDSNNYDSNKYDNNNYDSNNILENTNFDKRVKDTLSQNLFLYDEEYYIDKERYMKSNVTIEFNIYDTYSDNVILNNKKTNSTMLEFPLIDSHHIIQKCLLTMKKLEKAIFYIKNNLLFHSFTSNDNPINKDDRNIYDVIINEEWIKMELYLCNIYGINEKWMGITPNMFENEHKTNMFLKNYSMDNPQNNMITLGDPSNSTKGVDNYTNKEMINKLSDDKKDALKKNSAEVEESSSKNNVTKNVLLNNSQNVSIANLKDEQIVKNVENVEMIKSSPCNEVVDEASQRRREEIIRKTEEYERRKELEIKSDFLLKKLENEMKYDPNHYMWKDLYPQLSEHHKNKTDKYFENLKKEMSENKCSRGYTDNIKKKQSMKGYDIGEKIEGRTTYYIWYENMFSFSLYFFLRPYIKKKHILIDIDNNFFSLTINKHNIIKDIFNHPINSSDSIWSLTDNEDNHFMENEMNEMQFPVYDITNIQDEEIQKFIKSKYALVYNIYKDNNHKYMWGSIFKSS